MKPENPPKKKTNNEQEINEGFSGNNLPEDYNPAAEKNRIEIETKKDGDKTHDLERRPDGK